MNDFNYIEAIVLKAKTEFESFITDTNLSLNLRWKAFCEAPAYLKNDSSWVEHIKVGDTDLAEKLEYRYQTYKVCELLNTHKENAIYKLYDVWGGDIDAIILPNEEEFNAAKEDILARNLGSFCFDW